MMSNPVEAQWVQFIKQKQSRTLEIDPLLELRLVCGTDQAGQPIFCSISSMKPGIPELSDAVEVKRTQRQIDGYWVLLLTLKAERFTEVFVHLCSHIVDRVAEASSEAQGLAAFTSSVEEWRTLLRASSHHRLSVEAARGLFGELWLGFSVLATECTVNDVIAAWNGPFGADQDFQFPAGPSLEVKTIHETSRHVQIASEHQLAHGNGPLFLSVITVLNGLETTVGAITLPQLLNRVDAMLVTAGLPPSDLSIPLEELGYDRTDGYYAELYFVPQGVTYYEVTAGFPRIEASSLPHGVSRVGYSLELADLHKFESSLSSIKLP